MERVGQTLNRTGYRGSGNATDLTKQILADPRVADFKSLGGRALFG